MTEANTERRSGLSLLAVLGAALVLRLYQLGTESLWLDEGFSLRDASANLSLFDIRPIYFRLLAWWMGFGRSETWLRLPSVAFGFAAVLLIYLVGKRLFGHKPAIIASLIAAVSPLQVNHSQEVRMYSLVVFLGLAGVLSFLDYIETERLRSLAALLAIGFLSFLVFPLAACMFAVYTLFLASHFKQYRRPAVWLLAGQATATVAAIPWIPKLLSVTQEYRDAWTWRLAKPGLFDVLMTVKDFNLWKIAEQQHTAVQVANIYGLALVGVATFGALYGLRRAGWQTRFTLMWLLVPLAATAVISNYVANIWISRYMIYASPAAYLLIGLGITGLAHRRMVFSAALACVLLPPMVRLAVYYYQPERPEWRQAVSQLERRLQPGDAIALYRSSNRYVFDYYYIGKSPVYPLGEEAPGRVAWTDERIDTLMSTLPHGARRIWFVFSFHETVGGVAVESYVNRHYEVVDVAQFERVRIYETVPLTERVIVTGSSGRDGATTAAD